MFSLSPRARGFFLILLAGACLSTAPAAIKIGLHEQIGPVALMTLRMWVGSIALLFWLGCFRPDLLRLDSRGIAGTALTGSTNTISLLCFYIALTYLDASIAIVIFSMYPAVVILLLALAGEPVAWLSKIRLLLALLGVYILVGPDGESHPAGVALVLTTVVFFAIYLNLIHWRLGPYPARTTTLYVIGTMTLLMTVVYFLTGHGWPFYSATAWGVILWTGLISTAIARLAMIAGIRKIGSAQTSLLGPLETLLSVFWSILLLDESLTLTQWVGAGLILISAGIAARDRPAALPVRPPAP